MLEGCPDPPNTRQLFESSTIKTIFGFRFRFFVSDIIRGVGFWPFWLGLPGTGPKPLNGSISLKFVLGTRLESESLERLIDFLGFRLPTLWPKNNKLINESPN